MELEIGIKSDPVEYRFSYEWLFGLMERLDLHNLQLGSFFEMYRLPDRYFERLKRTADDHGVRIRSCFTAHRELGGFFLTDPDVQNVAFESYKRFIEIAAIVGSESAGSNPGAVLRDRGGDKEDGDRRYLDAMKKLSRYAHSHHLQALTVEPMSSRFEPPSTLDEVSRYMEELGEYHSSHPEDTVPVYLCADVSHGLAADDQTIVLDNVALFEHGIPWTWEFHLKNTDSIFGSTFGFGEEERQRGIVDLARIRTIVDRNASRFPRDTTVAYLEIGGPKLGRDYTDPLLEEQLSVSIAAIRELFL